ncbi:hypothetical protein C8J57DRAFT_1367081 [Mycena rebaudengoi]|nr:hypothetical protein C8J57DRAFT_1367081 [Mycena rebaudengoi]
MFSFTKFGCIALAMAVTSVRSLSISAAPSSPESGTSITISWTSASGDPTFSIELNHPTFVGIAPVSVYSSDRICSMTLGNREQCGSVEKPDYAHFASVMPLDGYTLEFVNITDINQVYATSPSFSIAAAPSTTANGSSAGGGTSPTGSQSGGGSKPSSSGPGASNSSGAAVALAVPHGVAGVFVALATALISCAWIL